MALRLVETYLPADAARLAAERLEGEERVLELWHEELADDRWRISFLIDSGHAEPLIDDLADRYGDAEGFRVLILPVEAAVPRPGEDASEEEAAQGRVPAPDGEEEPESTFRIGREELHTRLAEEVEPSPIGPLLIGLSAVVCSIGLLRGDVAVIIGAMVIAPLLGPLVALSLATTLADANLARRAALRGGVGILLAFVLAMGIGAWFGASPALPEVARRTTVGMSDIGLALAAGAAGTLAYTTGTAATLIGVMVAVALVPPLVATGLMLGAGHGDAAAGGAVLTLINLICINLSGVVVFLAEGIRPNRWWEAEKARRATVYAIAIWALLLLGLAAVVLWSPLGR